MVFVAFNRHNSQSKGLGEKDPGWEEIREYKNCGGTYAQNALCNQSVAGLGPL